MTVKIPIKVRLKIVVKTTLVKVGLVVRTFGTWLIRGCKPQPEHYKRSNGVIHTLPCAGDFYILEGGVDMIACMSNLASLPEMVRIISEDITILARVLEEEVE